MFTEKSTLKEIMTHPLIAPLAPYFVENMDLSSQPMYEMTLQESYKNGGMNIYSIMNGCNRLLRALEEGPCVYPLYSEAECAEDPKKKHVFFLHFPSADPNAGKRPFVVIVPGGGNVNVWNISEGFPIAAHFNTLGFDAVVLTYRVVGPGLYPAPLDDMARLLSYIREHKEALSLNPDRYFTIGHSAGAYLIAQWSSDYHGYRFYGFPKPELCIPVYCPVSWKFFAEKGNHDGFALSTHGLTVKEAAESPWNIEEHVSIYPPTYIVHAEGDTLVDPENSRILDRALTEAGIPHILDIGKGSEHGFAEGNDCSLRGYMERAVNFWESLQK